MSDSIPPLRSVLLLIVGLLGTSGLLGMQPTAAQMPPRSDIADSPRRPRPDRSAESAEAARNIEEAAEPTEAAEAAALELVRRHLPQLTDLLKTLRRDAPEQYRRAINDLARQARRLEGSRRRDPRLFEVELEILKRQTRVDLAVARLQVRDDPKTRLQLRRAIEDLQQSRRARLEYERDLLQQRIARLEQQLQTVEVRLQAPLVASPQWVDKAYRNLLRKAGRGAASTADAPSDESSAAAEKTDGNDTDTAGEPSR